MKMLLKKVEGCLAGTLAKMPVATANTIIDIKIVVEDNKGAIEELMIQTAERLLAVDKVVDQGIPDSAKPQMTVFARILWDEICKLKQMPLEGTFLRILKNEANRKAIEDIFKQIDEAMKNLQLDIDWSTETKVNDILSEIKLMQLDCICAWKAIYDADLWDRVTVICKPCTKETRKEI
ncbi:hypothetical protein AX14_010824 [Amanita brunnescens Koide BX004]|nr:hypothetical protein AX14_010824 [Amanita brunnescens Koide BX004]